MMEEDEGNYEELVATNRAMVKALESFEESLNEDGYDPAFWRWKIEVQLLSSDFEGILHNMSINNHEVNLI